MDSKTPPTSATLMVCFYNNNELITILFPSMLDHFFSIIAIAKRINLFSCNLTGIAVIVVMLVTTFLTTLVIAIVWQRSIFLACLFFCIFGSIESLYLSSALYKVKQGGWVSLALAAVIMFIMYVWHFGTTKKYEFDLQNKVSMKWLLTLGPSLGIVRVPGIGLIYTDLVTGVPAIFSHFVTNLPAFHQILVFVCMKSVPVPFVPPNERYLVGRVGSRDYRMYR